MLLFFLGQGSGVEERRGVVNNVSNVSPSLSWYCYFSYIMRVG